MEHAPSIDLMGYDGAGLISVFVVYDSGTSEADGSYDAQPVVDTSVVENAHVGPYTIMPEVDGCSGGSMEGICPLFLLSFCYGHSFLWVWWIRFVADLPFVSFTL